MTLRAPHRTSGFLCTFSTCFPHSKSIKKGSLFSTKKHNSVNRHPELVEGPSRTVRLFLSTYTQSKKQTLKTHKNHSQAIIT